MSGKLQSKSNIPDFLQKAYNRLNLEINFPVNPDNLPLFIVKNAITKAVTPSVRHLKLCGCGDKWLNSCKSKAVESAKKLYNERNLKEQDSDGSIFRSYMEKALNEDAWIILQDLLKKSNFRCPKEEKTILEFLLQYSGKYDLGDSDVWNIVEPLLNFKLAVDRYVLFSNYNDFVREHVDKFGNSFISVSPVEDFKLKFDQARVAAVEKLNRMIEGSKSVNLNIDSSKVFKREDMYDIPTEPR